MLGQSQIVDAMQNQSSSPTRLSAVETAYLVSISETERQSYIRQRAALEVAYRQLWEDARRKKDGA